MTQPVFIQIIDSRGNPTIQGRIGSVHALRIAVPSGASTGSHEALELRDGGVQWEGKGVLRAIDHANDLSSIVSWEHANVSEADARMLAEDGTENKSRMGANAILAVSMLQTVVQAHQKGIPVFSLISELSGQTPSLPLPFANIINGGRHADNALMFQEFMIVPYKATSFFEATRQVTETTHALKKIISLRYGKGQTAVGDEGGFAPQVKTPEEACEILVEAMHAAGHDMAIAIDAAASEFFSEKGYEVEQGVFVPAETLSQRYISLLKRFPIISLEDPFHEDDFTSFAHLRMRIEETSVRCQLVGDDLTVTNTKRIQQAIDARSCTCLLLKINQIGTVTQSIAAARLARDTGWNVMVSHRSGETPDTFIADLAVGLGCGQIKLGAPVRGERTAKYNRLLEIEQQYGLRLTPW